jgi:hypothetical protein
MRRRIRPRPTLRFGFGANFSPSSAPGRKLAAGFLFDVALGVAVDVHKYVVLWPELGYSYGVREQKVGHLFTFGLGPLFGNHLAAAGVAPRLVVGDAWGATGAGVRTGVVGTFGYQVLTVELGHQWVRAGGRDLHDGRFMFSVDLALVLGLLFLPVMVRSTRRWWRRL